MKVIDLSYEVEEGMPTFPAHWHTNVEITILGRHFIEGRETRKVCFSTHTGTHIDAPKHFIKNGKGINNIPLNKLVGWAQIIDVSHIKNCLKLEDIKNLIRKDIKKIIFYFGWSKYWKTERFYKNWPYFSKEIIDYLISEIGIDLIGMDTPSPDNPNDNKNINHKLLLSNNVVICEYLTNLDKLLNYKTFFVCFLPLKIKNADGAPARCIAIVSKEGNVCQNLP